MLMHEELTFEGSGRLSVETRMKMIHGEVIILKAKSSIKVTLTMMVTKIFLYLLHAIKGQLQTTEEKIILQ